jgi:putative AdoMet-dependent methyltransferase
MDNKGFNEWAHDYDAFVQRSDASQTYPFAGYDELMNALYEEVTHSGGQPRVLDIGLGSGERTARMARAGARVTGVDFSEEMLALAKQNMPDATLIQWDITQGLPTELVGAQYDFILSTYALHHLEDIDKIPFVERLLPLLAQGGEILIGDIAFPTRAILAETAARLENWDDEEYYWAVNETLQAFAALQLPYTMTFTPFSFCAGIFTITQLP